MGFCRGGHGRGACGTHAAETVRPGSATRGPAPALGAPATGGCHDAEPSSEKAGPRRRTRRRPDMVGVGVPRVKLLLPAEPLRSAASVQKPAMLRGDARAASSRAVRGRRARQCSRAGPARRDGPTGGHGNPAAGGHGHDGETVPQVVNHGARWSASRHRHRGRERLALAASLTAIRSVASWLVVPSHLARAAPALLAGIGGAARSPHRSWPGVLGERGGDLIAGAADPSGSASLVPAIPNRSPCRPPARARHWRAPLA